MNGIFMRIHKEDGQPGLSLAEFTKFVEKLPDHLRRRFIPIEGTFREYAGGDMNMDFREFQTLIQQCAAAEATGT